MKKLYLLLLLFFTLGVRAQWVSIPDTNFVNWLNAWGYAQCLSGNQLDTTCPAVVNATYIDCNTAGIRDLTGIQYFDNLDTLKCHINFLTGLPVLRTAMKVLYCYSNNLSILPSLPDSLLTFYCAGNDLTSLPPLPNSLRDLWCGGNHLTALPSLPLTLTSLDCVSNQLSTLPALPDSLKYLSCDNNQLTTLSLPNHLLGLTCSHNFLTVLDPLPNSLLSDLDCSYNQLTYIDTIHGSWVYCSHNLLTSLPYFDFLTSLDCSYNLITQLPGERNVFILDCSHNQLSGNIGIPNPYGYTFDCSYNNITSIQMYASPPSTLGSLDCSYNQLAGVGIYNPPVQLGWLHCENNLITDLSGFSSTWLSQLWCANNQITILPFQDGRCFYELHCDSNPISCLPAIGCDPNLSFTGTNITCLPWYGLIRTSNPPLSTVPLCEFINPNNCPARWNISGRAYFDSNNNCLYNIGDTTHSNIKVKLLKNGALEQQVVTGSEGVFSFHTDTGVYTVAIDTSEIPFGVACPPNGFHTDSIIGWWSIDTTNSFALGCKSSVDLAAWSMVASSQFRSANNTNVNIGAGDVANFYGVRCATGVSGSVEMVMNGPASFISVANTARTPSSVSGDTIIWNINDFGTVNFFSDFNIILRTDTFAQSGQQVCVALSVSTNSVDFDTTNNTLTRCFSVVNSHDPNDKSVYPSAVLDSTQDWLTYTIRFQNTGTAGAQNIYVEDTLETDLDVSTFQLLAYSHQPIVQIKGNAVRFNFPNINLPDSNTNEALSHGYVQYKVKLQSNLPIGTQINNTAYIYFDFNAPVVTNTVSNFLICGVPDTTRITASICDVDEYSFNGMQLNGAGVYYDTLQNVNNCDSVIELTLSVLSTSFTGIGDGVCENALYNFNGTLLSDAGLYYDTLTNINGCDSVVSLTLYTFSASYTSLTQSICTGDTFYFRNTALTASGAYSDTLVNAQGCDSTIALQLDVTDVNYTITYLGSDTLVFNGSGSVQWIDCSNGAASNDTSHVFGPNVIGAFKAVVTENNCTDTSQCYMVGFDDISELDNYGIKIYPNPVSDAVTISVGEVMVGGVVTISDVTGRKMAIMNIEHRTLNIETSNFANGIYFIQLSAGDEISFTAKFVKQ